MKAVCLISGEWIIYACLYGKEQGYTILALHLNYGQRTERKELACARKIAGLLDAEAFIEISLDYFAKFGASSLTDKKLQLKL